MSGRHNGTQALIKKVEPLALYVHCFAHCVNLATEAMCTESTIVRNALGVCNEAGVLFGQSHNFRRRTRGDLHSQWTEHTATAVCNAVNCAGKLGVRAAASAWSRH